MRGEEPVSRAGPAHERQLIALGAASLGGALDGLRTPAALGLLSAGLLALGLATGLANVLALLADSVALAGVLYLVVLVFAMIAAHAAGVALMDRASDRPARRLPASLAAGARSLALLVVVALIVAAAQFVFAMAATALLWACRLAVVGPFLLVVLMPVLIAGAAVLFAGSTATLLLCAPAFWSGQSLGAGLRSTVARLRQRPLEILLSLMLIGFVAAVLATIVAMLWFSGMVFVGGLAGAVVGADVAMAIASGDFDAAAAAGGGLAVAAMTGISILVLQGAVLPLAAQIGGLCRLRCQLDGIDAPLAPIAEAEAEAEADRMIDDGTGAGVEAEGGAEATNDAAGDATPGAAPADAGLASTVKTMALRPERMHDATASARDEPSLVPPDPGPPMPERDGDRPPPRTLGTVPSTGFRAADAGLEVTMIVSPARCSACGAPIERRDRFCGECGQRLTNTESDPGDGDEP